MVLIPFQGVAAANMSICNIMMQASEGQQPKAMPCNIQMAGMTQMNQDCCKHNTVCKTICATLCTALSTMTALPSDIKAATFLSSSLLVSMPHQSYASITLPSLQRPPILLA